MSATNRHDLIDGLVDKSLMYWPKGPGEKQYEEELRRAILTKAENVYLLIKQIS